MRFAETTSGVVGHIEIFQRVEATDLSKNRRGAEADSKPRNSDLLNRIMIGFQPRPVFALRRVRTTVILPGQLELGRLRLLLKFVLALIAATFEWRMQA